MAATTMSSLFVTLFALAASSFRTRAALQAEILALRHQLAVFQKNAPRRVRYHRCDRLLWVVLSRFWPGDRKSTRLNSSHGYISYAVFCLQNKNSKSTRL